MNLSAVEAINRVNESVTVEMLVQRTKCCTGSRQVFLDSEANHRDPKNLGVVVTESGRAKFSEAGIDDPTAHFNGQDHPSSWGGDPQGEAALHRSQRPQPDRDGEVTTGR